MDALHLFVITEEGVFEGVLDNQGNLSVGDQLVIPFDSEDSDVNDIYPDPYKTDTTV